MRSKVQFIVWDAQSNMFRRDFDAEEIFNNWASYWESLL